MAGVAHLDRDECPVPRAGRERGGRQLAGVRRPDVELAVAKAVAGEEVAGLFHADIEVERRAGRIVAEQEGDAAGVAGIDRGDVLPLAPAHVRHPPQVAARRVERPDRAAMGSPDLLAREVDPLGEAAGGAEGGGLDEDARAQPDKTGRTVELFGRGDHRARPVVDRPDREARIDHRHGGKVEVEIGDAGAVERDRAAAAVADREGRRRADLVIDEDADGRRIEPERADAVRRADRRERSGRRRVQRAARAGEALADREERDDPVAVLAVEHRRRGRQHTGGAGEARRDAGSEIDVHRPWRMGEVGLCHGHLMGHLMPGRAVRLPVRAPRVQHSRK